jgi:DegV family protein with EDD domain
MKYEMKIGIVTDSTADIPPELAQERGIHIVPAILIIDSQSIKDGEGISRHEFYERLPAMRSLPTTASPSTGSFQQFYDALIRQGFSHIISIHASSRLSGIFNAARVAAQSFGDRVRVVDSEYVTLGMGFQVLAAAEAVMRGLSLEAILARIEDVRKRVRVIAMLDTLDYIRRSGRVSWARASLGSLLSIKPFVELKEGVVLRMGEVRTRRKGIEHLIELMNKLGPLECLAVLHTNAEAEARLMLERLTAKLETTPLLVNVTTIIGTHVGPNGLGFVAVTA